jgi:hypothetical protein
VRRRRYKRQYSQKNQAGELILAEVVLYGLVIGTIGVVGYAIYAAIKNATTNAPGAPGAAQSIVAGAGVTELGPGGSQQALSTGAILGPGASVQAPAGSLEQPETS